MAHPEIQSKEPYAPYRFTVEEFYRMADVNILKEDDHVELIDGRLMVKEPAGPPHASHVDRLTRLFVGLLGDRAIVRTQNPFRIDDLNHPEPDLAIVKPRDDYYALEHAGPGDARLLIEVAWFSASGDRAVKAPLYAAAGIQEFWLVDIHGQMLEVYTDPHPDGYRSCVRLARSETVMPIAFPELKLAVREIVRPVPEA